MIRAALALLAVTLAAPVHAAPTEAAIGDLILAYDDADWQVTRRDGGLVLKPSDCDLIRCEEGTGIVVTVAPAGEPLPSAIPRSEAGFVEPLWTLLDDGRDGRGDAPMREINGLTVFATDRWSGCRAWSPSELTAILDHRGRRYTFASGIAAGCAGVWGVDREAFAEILYGLRPAP